MSVATGNAGTSNDQLDAKKSKERFLERLDNLKIAQKGTILVAVPLITGLVSMVILLYLLNQAELQLAKEERYAKINAYSSRLVQVWVELAMAAGNYAFTQDRAYGKRYESYSKETKRLFEGLEQSIGNQPMEIAALNDMRKLDSKVTNLIDSMLPKQMNSQIFDFSRSREERIKFQGIAQEFRRAHALFVNRIAEIESKDYYKPEIARERIRLFLIGFGLFTLVMSVYLAIFYSRSITRRLNVVMNNSKALASHSSLHSRLPGREEIAQLDQIFHKMAAALDEAMSKERAITENAADVICSIDSSLIFQQLNPACLDAWGFSQEHLVGTSVLELVAEEHRKKTEADFKNARQSGSDSVIENKIVKKDASVSYSRWALHWSEEAQSFYCTVHDVTDQHELERLKMEFIAMVSHDLRTPLSSLQGALSMMNAGMYGQLNEKGKATIVRSHDDLSRLLNLIDSLLDLEKMEAGKMHMDFAETDLQSVITRSVNSVANFAQDRSISIISPSQSMTVFGDQSRLVQVIVNLLSNAIKFSDEGGEISITFELVDNFAVITVGDSGRGIPASRLSVIFDRFEQVEVKDHTEKGGRGLGLSICKSIVEGHGGTIGVESEEGKGSSFWLRIPLCDLRQDQLRDLRQVQNDE